MSLLCVVAVLWIAVILGKGFQKNNNLPDEPEQKCSGSYREITEKIDELNRCRNGIDELSEIIADIMSCEPGKVSKTIRISVLENGNQYDFLLNGEDEQSETFLDLLESERELLNASLRSKIKRIS